MINIAKEIYKNNYICSLIIFTIIFIIFSIFYVFDESLKSYSSYILYSLPIITWMSAMILYLKVSSDSLQRVDKEWNEYLNSPEGKEEQKVYIQSVIQSENEKHREKIKKYKKVLNSLED